MILPLIAFCFAVSFFWGMGFATGEESGDFEGIIPRPDFTGDKQTCYTAYPSIQKESDGTMYFVFQGGSKFNANKDDGNTGELDGKNGAAAEIQKRLKDVSIGNKIAGGCIGLADIPIIIIKLIDLVTKLAGTIAVMFGLYAGYQLITSELTQDREAAKSTLKYAAIGLSVSLLAWVIVNLIQVQLTA